MTLLTHFTRTTELCVLRMGTADNKYQLICFNLTVLSICALIQCDIAGGCNTVCIYKQGVLTSSFLGHI